MYEIIGYALLLVGVLVSIAGGVWWLVEMFKTNIWWGLGGLFCGGIVQLIWLVMFWKRGWPPLVASFGGIVPILIGSLVLLVESAGKGTGTL